MVSGLLTSSVLYEQAHLAICGLCFSVFSILSKFNVSDIGNFAYIKVYRFLLSYLGKFFEVTTFTPLIIPKQTNLKSKTKLWACFAPYR